MSQVSSLPSTRRPVSPSTPGQALPPAGSDVRFGRAALRDLYLRLLGLVTVLAFASLLPQLPVLVGSRGLLPAGEFLAAVGDDLPDALQRWTRAPTVFWWGASDLALAAGASLGVAAGALLLLGLAPHLCLLAAWALYLSFVTIGQSFLSFQWDNLLLETLLLSLFVAPARWRLGQGSCSPHPLGVALLLWLAVRLHVESAASKLLSGDSSWRDLTAMVAYYETAPLPTGLGWWVHQLPVWAHKVSALLTFVVEFGVGLLVCLPRRARVIGWIVVAGMHASIQATGNYGFFNILSVLVCLFLLDDGHLPRRLRRGRVDAVPQDHGAREVPPASPAAPRLSAALRTTLLAAASVPLLILGSIPFLPWLGELPLVGAPANGLADAALPVARAVAPFRSFNAYHLFASMTRWRDEFVIEGSDDEQAWKTYELRYKPGDPLRAPPFVAPHQPRVDFQLWFLLLPADPGTTPTFRYFAERLGTARAAWLQTLLLRLLEEPATVAALFATNPFPETPPRALRLSAWRYRFSDRATRAASGAWWTRELLHQTTIRAE